jgi:hypothetical protein
VITVPAARAKDARRCNVHWLTTRTWWRWIKCRAARPHP